MAIASTNPATGETLRVFDPLSESQIEEKLARAAEAFRSWRRASFAGRAAAMTRAAGILESEAGHFARLMTLEMGKPLRAARDEALKCATACRYYVEHAEQLLAEKQVPTQASYSAIRYQPLGPVLAIMPWNFPFWQVFRFAAPALMAGNVGLLKHASSVPQCALAIEDIFRRAAFPEGAFQTLLIGPDAVNRILDDDRVAAVTLTGSEPAGAKVAARAGQRIKKSVLELGGSDAFLVMPSADLEKAVTTAVKARTMNNGQSCIAAKRFIVHSAVYDEFESRFTSAMEALRVGDPMDPATDVGPLATQSIRDDLQRQVEQAVGEGARVLTGGTPLDRPGFYYMPTVLARVPRTSAVYREEFFGPVAMLFRASSFEEALEIANDSPFGLGSAIWTRDASERDRFLDEIEAGMAFVNGMVASDARVPFGGVKRSGFGRELGPYGILEFVNIKTIWVTEY
jgi:succinate-semialdehyde dehydrogenase / glutarate-semialdehyde dehydrogenase